MDNWDEVQDFYKEGKYILIINPNYTIYDEKMYETKGTDGLLCLSPNETILFKDENEIIKFFDLIKKNNFESFKSLGDMMIIKKFYDKAIFFYENAIKISNKENNTIKIYSLLSESFIRYHYYTKGLESINKFFELLKILSNEKNDNLNIDKTLIMTSLLRKIKCFIGLRNFKKAYEILTKIKEDKDFQNELKLDTEIINKFLNEKNNISLFEILNIGYKNSLGQFDIKQMLIDEKKKFYLDNGDYINPKVEISYDDYKGIKIMAKDDINIGEYILVEKAIYFCRTHNPHNNFETYTKLNTPIYMVSQIEYIDCINHLIKIIKRTPFDYKNFFLLYDENNLHSDYENRLNSVENNISNLNLEVIEQIFKLNSYKTLRYFYNINQLGIGLWNFFSLFNHSCLPNTTNYGIGDFIFVIPNRPIKKGEEITILYLSTPKRYEGKKELLKSIYNFECKCALCEIEKKNREKDNNIIIQYNEFIENIILPEVSENKKLKTLKDFPKFLEKNKNILSGYEIGRGYIELSGCAPDFKTTYQFYNLANKYLKDDFETKKLNLNKIIEFVDSLIEQGDLSVLDLYKKLNETFLNFHRNYHNFNKNDVELIVKINKEQKFNDLILQQQENLKKMKIKENFKFK